MTRTKRIDLNTDAYIRGGIFLRQMVLLVLLINTSSSTLISWMANTIYSSGTGWSRTATVISVPKTGYYMVTFNGRLTSGAVRTNGDF